jgi:hypothetical protein
MKALDIITASPAQIAFSGFGKPNLEKIYSEGSDDDDTFGDK